MCKCKKKDGAFHVDYVISGGGAAGAIIAYILTSTGKYSVLLIEAGDPNIDDPNLNEGQNNVILLSKLWYKYGWQGMSINDVNAALRNFLVPQTGLTLGGSTRINNMNAVKASPANIQQWENLNGKFWSPKRMYEAYQWLETFHPAAGKTASFSRGTEGNVSVTQTPQAGPLQIGLDVNAAWNSIGVPTTPDYNSPDTVTGSSTDWQTFQQTNGIRSDSLTAFLNADVIRPSKSQPDTFKGVGIRKNRLLVLTRSWFQKIVFSGRDPAETTGILFVHDGKSHEVKAKRGTWIENGFLSAHALLTSGVGPKAVLEAAGIPVVANNPGVGGDLSNHTAIGLSGTKDPSLVASDPANPNFTCCVGTFLPDPLNDPARAGQRSVQIIYQDGRVPNTATANPAVFSVTVFQLGPYSRGNLTVDSASIQKQPIVDYNYLADPRDIQFYISVLQNSVFPWYQALIAANPGKYAITTPDMAQVDPANPGSAAYIENYVRTTARQTHHGRGTLRMAPQSAGGAVDKRGRVYGVKKLMNFDTCTLPFQPDGNNCFTVWGGAYLLAKWALHRGGVEKKHKHRR